MIVFVILQMKFASVMKSVNLNLVPSNQQRFKPMVDPDLNQPISELKQLMAKVELGWKNCHGADMCAHRR